MTDWDDIKAEQEHVDAKHVDAKQEHAPSLTESWLIDADDFTSQPAPIRWLIRGWVQCDALHMVFGPSGHGKSFTVLDWAMHIASGLSLWQGCRVQQGAVVYLAGEGHHGLRGRTRAWKQHFGPSSPLPLHFSRSGCDLNLPAGFAQVTSEIDALETKPVLIVVDATDARLSLCITLALAGMHSTADGVHRHGRPLATSSTRFQGRLETP